jgi:SOS-response transcriptional repressor LexA
MAICEALTMARDRRADYVEGLLGQRKKSMRWLAKQIGQSPESVSKWLAGEYSPRDDAVWQKMIEVLTASPSPLDGKPGISRVQVYAAAIIRVPVTGPTYAGKPDPAMYDPDLEFEEIKDWGGNFERWGKPVVGYSMEDPNDPERWLEPGDRVIFENRQFQSGHIVHAVKGDLDVVKAFRRSGDDTRLMSINREFDDIPITLAPGSSVSDEGWEILGVAVIRIRYMQPGNIRQQQDYPEGMRYRFPSGT